MTKTDIICEGLRYSGLLTGKAVALYFGVSLKLRVLAYHRVLNPVPNDFLYDRDVVSCSAKEFRREMEFVARNFDVVTFNDINKNGADYYRRPLVVTFDDGYKDNFDVVLPILKDVGVSAVFFVTTDYIDGKSIPWWDEVMYCGSKAMGGKYFEGRKYSEGGKYSARTVEELLAYCKSISDDERIALLNEMRMDSDLVDNDLMMSWDDVRGLVAAGMEIGSHTVSHPILGNVEDGNKLLFEIFESKKRIEREIEMDVISFSYPVGRMSSANDDIVDVVKDAGYKFAVVYEHGVNEKVGFEPWRMRRIKAEVGEDFGRFRAKVLFPGLVKY